MGADTFEEIELWANEKLDWLRSYLRLQNGIPSHDTFGRVFGLIDPCQFEQAFQRWMRGVLPALSDEVVAIDGKTSRRSGGIDAMGTQANIAEAIQARGADYVLAVKDNQPKLAESIRDFWSSFIAHPAAETAHGFFESVEKGHGRVETRRCYVFDQLNCLSKPEQWPGLKSFAVIESERASGGKTTHEQRLYISSLTPDAARMAATVRAHWSVENRLHWCMDIAFNDDQMRDRTRHAAHNLASLKQLTLNLIRMDPVKRKDGIKARRIIAATSDNYRAHLLGLG